MTFRSLLTFSVTLLWGVARSQNPPTVNDFRLENHFLKLEPNLRTTLDCSSPSNPEPEISWYKDDLKIEPGTVEGIELQGSQIVWTDPNPDIHVGYYHCLASNQMGTAKSAVVVFDLKKPAHPEYVIPPQFTIEPKLDIIPIDSNDVVLKCAAKGMPEPEIIWTKNGIEVEGSRNQEYLDFDQFSEENIGTYACNASNEGGYVYKLVYLNILNDRPRFVETPREVQRAANGQVVFFRCSAKGYPKPTIEWYFNSQPINLEDSSKGLTQSERGDLKVERVSDKSAGNYKCVAKNDFGEVFAESLLEVVSTTTINEGPRDRAAEIHSTVRLQCSVLWDPSFKLSVTWKKDNIDIDLDNLDRFTYDPNDHSLNISDLKFEDEGTYTCVASTSQGSAAKSGILDVNGIPPKLIFGPSKQVVPEGYMVTLLCTVQSDPQPEHVWFKGTDRVDYNDERLTLTPDGSLLIGNAKLNDSDKYICRASNNYGEDVIASAFVDVRRATKVLKKAVSQKFVQGQNYTFDCLVEVDPSLKKALNVSWIMQKDGKVLDVRDNDRYFLHDNNTLLVVDVTPNEIGEYICMVKTPVDEVEVRASIYTNESNWWWWLIILIILIVLIILVLCICLICMVRRRNNSKGCYGVKDVEDGKVHNKSDIQYSIDNFDEKGLLEDGDAKDKPIIKAGSKQGLLELEEKTRGSENSLLNLTDEEMWLRKGMDEDGSFREGKYAD